MQIVHCWMTITNSSLNMKDIVIQCECKTTHTHCEEYRETRAQKFNIMKFYFVKNSTEASFWFQLELNLSWKKWQTEWVCLKILDKAESQSASRQYHCEWSESMQMNWDSRRFVILEIFLLCVISEKNSISLRWKSIQNQSINQSIFVSKYKFLNSYKY